MAEPSPLFVQLPQVVSPAGRGEHALRVGAGQNIVRVDRVAAAADRLAFFGQSRLLIDIVLIGVQIVDALATTTPLAFCHGPLPTRSRALTPAAPLGSVVLR